ncbi:hypothetical protein LARI1_G008511, partial [Lachnellula arida]
SESRSFDKERGDHDPDLNVTVEDADIPQPQPDEWKSSSRLSSQVVGTNPIDWKGADGANARALHGDLDNHPHKNAGKTWWVPRCLTSSQETAWSLNHSSGLLSMESALLIPQHISQMVYRRHSGPGVYSCGPGSLQGLRLPEPWNPATEDTPLLIYDASSGGGAFAVKLAVSSNIHPVIAIARGSGNIVASVLRGQRRCSSGLSIWDAGKDALVQSIRKARRISNDETVDLLTSVLSPHGSIYVSSLPGDQLKNIPSGVKVKIAFSPGLFDPYDPSGPDGQRVQMLPRELSHIFFLSILDIRLVGGFDCGSSVQGAAEWIGES